MSDISADARPIRVEDYLSADAGGPSELLGTLKVKRTPGTMRVSVKSRKFKNCVLNWKKFLFDVLPVGVSAAIVVPSNAAAAAIIGLQAVKSANDTMDVELPAEASEVLVRLAELQRAAEDQGISAWIPVNCVIPDMNKDGTEEGRLRVALKYLEKLGVLLFDLTEEKVRVVEEIRFEDAP
jgi:hypothetical protein